MRNQSVSSSDVRTGWIVALVGLAFLLCPGCSYTAPVNLTPTKAAEALYATTAPGGIGGPFAAMLREVARAAWHLGARVPS